MMKASFLFSIICLLLGGVLPGECFSQEVCPPYGWPTEVKNLKKFGQDMRQHLLGEEMNKFSRMVGTCYNRDPKGLAEKIWFDEKRDEKINKVSMTMGSIKKFCASVRKYLVDEKLPNSKRDPSPYSQYANCGEGQYIGACLAFEFGYSPKDILLCDSEKDHAWSLVPESGKKDSFCLLDRWNSFRCGVKLKGKKEKPEVWSGDVLVPGKTKFQFIKSTCTGLEYSHQF